MTTNAQVIQSPFYYTNNLQLSWLTATTLSVAAGLARDNTNVDDMATTASTTINAAVIGVNGIDTGALANSTWYAVHQIADTSSNKSTAFLISTSATAPYLPFSYDVFKRIGWVLTDGSANILKFFSYGNGNQRTYMWDAIMNELSAAGNTSYTAVNMQSSVPSTSTLAYINCKLIPNADGDSALLRPTGSSATANQYIFAPTAAKTVSESKWINTNTSQSIDYKTSSASDALTIDVAGFIDFI